MEHARNYGVDDFRIREERSVSPLLTSIHLAGGETRHSPAEDQNEGAHPKNLLGDQRAYPTLSGMGF
jgi:hypothetical protein